MDFTNETEVAAFATPYFQDKKKHKHYATTVDIAQHLSFHFDGYFLNAKDMTEGVAKVENPYFTRLIDLQRPSESPEIKAYRRNIFIPENKTPCFRVLNTLKKGVRSEDWKIDFSKSVSPAQITESETLQEYTGTNYPFFKSIEAWAYQYAMRKILVDPNAICCVLPSKYETKDNEYLRPFSYIIESKMVVDFEDGEHVLYECVEKCEYMDPNGIRKEGKKMMLISRTAIYEIRQKNSLLEFDITTLYEMNLTNLPAFRLGGNIHKSFDIDNPIYESFCEPMVPGLDKAAREMSDLDAEVVQNVYSLNWRIDMTGCATCKGIGKIFQAGSQVISDCDKCNGSGDAPKTPYGEVVVKANALSGMQIPIPPMGNVQRNTEIVKIQDLRIANHIRNSLSSIGMDFLIDIAQSGIAKQWDREEANNFVYGFYYNLIENIINKVYYFVNEYRYSAVVKNEKSRKAMLPFIPIPQNFDIASLGIALETLTTAKKSEIDPLIIQALELDYLNKLFSGDPETRDKIMTVKECDPFPSLDVMEKSDLYLAGGIAKEDYILSTYIYFFIENLVQEDPGFIKQTRTDKLSKLIEMSKAKIVEMNTAKLPTAQPSANPV